MKILRTLSEAEEFRGGFFSIGNFDGVHRGHRSMLSLLVGRTRQLGLPSVVFTFDPHPVAFLRPQQTPAPLGTTARKLELLDACGVDATLVYPTDSALLQLTPREFFDQIVLRRLAAGGLVEGPNFRFGHDRSGSIEVLEEFCTAAGVELHVVPPLSVGGVLVSSTEIRGLISRGEIRRANDLLGSPYQLQGIVATGAQRGRTLGFPTANLVELHTALPREGVYAGRARVDEVWHAAAINVGSNPTFAEQSRKFEVHLIDFHADLYGRRLDVELLERLRDIRQFAGPHELREQLARDVAAARALAGPHP